VFAASLVIVLFSISGLPPFVGFFSKFFILLSSLTQQFTLSSFFIIFFSAIASFYYLRVIKILSLNQTIELPI